MDENTLQAMNELTPEQKWRLRGAIRLLIEYLAESGFLAKNQALLQTLSEQAEETDSVSIEPDTDPE